jgi:peroxiredoxin Q/BCP
MRTWVRTSLLGAMLAILGVAAGSAQPLSDQKKVDLQVGDIAPVFEGTDDQGQVWKSADHIGKKHIVLYFYPGDFTPGCTRQAQLARDNMNVLPDQGAEVVGVSGDSAATHALFKQAHRLNFSLLADEEGNLAKRFGVPVGPGGAVKAKDAEGKLLTLKRAVTTARWTFVIGKDGRIIYKNTKVDPVKDSKEVAAMLEKLDKN